MIADLEANRKDAVQRESEMGWGRQAGPEREI